jgi:hypothetical protein
MTKKLKNLSGWFYEIGSIPKTCSKERTLLLKEMITHVFSAA